MTVPVSNLMILGVVILALGACGQDTPTPEPVGEPSAMLTDDEHVAIMDAWARVNPIPGRPAAVYLSATSPVDDELIGAETPVAGRAELHTHEHSDGMMRMMKVESFAVAAGAPLSLKPGGDHLMLFDTNEGLAEMESFPLSLQFRDAGTIDVIVSVSEPGS